jgi:methionyl aminopeptidase
VRESFQLAVVHHVPYTIFLFVKPFQICEGSAKAVTWPDEWTATTVDGKRSAQFEHTLLVTPDGVEALTGKNEDSPLQFWERDSKVHKGIWLGTSASAMQRQAAINAEKLKSA